MGFDNFLLITNNNCNRTPPSKKKSNKSFLIWIYFLIWFRNISRININIFLSQNNKSCLIFIPLDLLIKLTFYLQKNSPILLNTVFPTLQKNNNNNSCSSKISLILLFLLRESKKTSFWASFICLSAKMKLTRLMKWWYQWQQRWTQTMNKKDQVHLWKQKHLSQLLSMQTILLVFKFPLNIQSNNNISHTKCHNLSSYSTLINGRPNNILPLDTNSRTQQNTSITTLSMSSNAMKNWRNKVKILLLGIKINKTTSKKKTIITNISTTLLISTHIPQSQLISMVLALPWKLPIRILILQHHLTAVTQIITLSLYSASLSQSKTSRMIISISSHTSKLAIFKIPSKNQKSQKVSQTNKILRFQEISLNQLHIQ